MNFILIGSCAIFFTSYFIDNEKNNYLIKSFLYNIILISLINMNYISFSYKNFLIYEGIFLVVILIGKNYKSNILLPIALSITTPIYINQISGILSLNISLIIFVFLTIILLFFSKRESNHIRYFFLFYFLSSTAIIYNKMNDEIFTILMIFKLIVILFLFSQLLSRYNEKIKSTKNRLHKLETSFEKSVRFEAKKRTISLEKINENALIKAKTDELTKVLNKEGILSIIDKLIYSSQVTTFSLLFFDIDDFKSINDNYGHNIGDKALRSLASNLKLLIREEDYFGRYGGDEFIIVLKNVTTSQAYKIANRYKNYVYNNSSPKFSISIGFATYPNDGNSIDSLLEIADQGLYATKEKGKNGVSYRGNNKLIKE